jgi:hypothetical protein
VKAIIIAAMLFMALIIFGKELRPLVDLLVSWIIKVVTNT